MQANRHFNWPSAVRRHYCRLAGRKSSDHWHSDGRVLVSWWEVAHRWKHLALRKLSETKWLAVQSTKRDPLIITASCVGGQNALSRIVNLIEEAQALSAPVQRFADRIVKQFGPIILTAATISFTYWFITSGNFATASLVLLAVMLILCPCALEIAIPTAILASVGKGAEYGVLLRSGEYVEKARKLTTVVFDKTGTLTKGEPSVTDIKTYNSFIELSVLECAASAEKGSEHPLAEAIFMKAESDKARINRADNFEVLTGRGVQYSVGNRKVLLGNRTLMQ